MDVLHSAAIPNIYSCVRLAEFVLVEIARIYCLRWIIANADVRNVGQR